MDSATPVRVGALNIDKTWSKSTSLRVWLSGTVAPPGNPRVALPLVIWRYLSPIAPFRRTVNVVFTGSGLMLSYSRRFSTAIGRPLRVRSGVTLLTAPTRAPPR